MKRRTAVNLCMSGASLCAVALVVLLSGCSFSAQKPVLLRNVSTITVVESSALPYGIGGRAIVTGDKCLIILREYPAVLGHEVRHCLEGAWHGKQPNGDDY